MTTTTINGVFFSNGTASHCWRIDGVANIINKNTPHAIYVTDWRKWNERLPEGCNLVIAEMLTAPDMVDKIHAQGAKVIYEADDALIDSYGNERKNLQKVGESHKEETIKTIQSCDAITVTNQTLKENYARFTDKPIFVLPNYVDYEWYGENKLDILRTTGEIRIGWFGSQGHLEDLQMVIPALKDILGKYPETKFVYCGFGGMSSDSFLTEIGWGEDVFRDLPRERREFIMGVREDIWPMKHRFMDLDIGIAPLVDDYFNRNKTPIKWMEYSVLGTPSVVSPTLYEDFVDHNRTGFIANSTEDWVSHLSHLIENPELRKSIGDKAKAVVKAKYDLKDHWEDFLSVYETVVLG